jgi:hypothetical protein
MKKIFILYLLVILIGGCANRAENKKEIEAQEHTITDIESTLNSMGTFRLVGIPIKEILYIDFTWGTTLIELKKQIQIFDVLNDTDRNNALYTQTAMVFTKVFFEHSGNFLSINTSYTFDVDLGLVCATHFVTTDNETLFNAMYNYYYNSLVSTLGKSYKEDIMQEGEKRLMWSYGELPTSNMYCDEKDFIVISWYSPNIYKNPSLLKYLTSNDEITSSSGEY